MLLSIVTVITNKLIIQCFFHQDNASLERPGPPSVFLTMEKDHKSQRSTACLNRHQRKTHCLVQHREGERERERERKSEGERDFTWLINEGKKREGCEREKGKLATLNLIYEIIG